MTLDLTAPLKGRNLEEYGAARIRNEAFEQVRLLWERRKKEGWPQKMIADEIGRDPGWVSRNLRAPGNWTLRTIGAFTQALRGETTITVAALEDAVDAPSNFDAYEGYTSHSIEVSTKTIDIIMPSVFKFSYHIPRFQFSIGNVP